MECKVDENGMLIMETCLHVNRTLEFSLLAIAVCVFLALIAVAIVAYGKVAKAKTTQQRYSLAAQKVTTVQRKL